jgi:hypothetical protein
MISKLALAGADQVRRGWLLGRERCTHQTHATQKSKQQH